MCLFNIEPIIVEKPKITCRTCKHIERWACGGSYFFYCNKRKSNKTGNGLLKVRCKDEACALYDKEENKL